MLLTYTIHGSEHRLGLNVVFTNIAVFSVHAQQGNDQIYISGTNVQVGTIAATFRCKDVGLLRL